jgi:uncharacterized protein (DUF1499 family)
LTVRYPKKGINLTIPTLKTVLIITGTITVAGLIGWVVARRFIATASPAPTNLGVTNGQLAPCPESPNCVSSRAGDAQHAIAPLVYTGSTAEAHARLVSVLQATPRLTIIDNQPTYLRAETRTAFWNFVDDTEFYFDEAAHIIEVRAASRLGYGDMGKNRKAIETIRAEFEQN